MAGIGESGPIGEQPIAEAFRAAVERWPDIQLGWQQFEAYVCARTTASDPDHALDANVDDLHLESLFLCCACVNGDAQACRAFDATYRSTIRDAIARIDTNFAFVDEIAALCLDKLLVGSPPRLAQYTGYGPLRAWVKTAASRAALDAKRQHKRLPHVQLDVVVSISPIPASMSPESMLFCRRHARDIVAALEQAIAKLDNEEQSLLRLHYAEGLSIDAIGDLKGVHRATAARWLQKVRASVELTVKTELEKNCGLDPSEIASLIKGTREYQEARLRDVLNAAAQS
jgi:RNA polymerase sigma-70 factor (ECF subfamily)